VKKHGTRLLLVLSCVIALGTVVQDFRFNTSSKQAQANALGAEREFGSVLASLAELRASQAAYLATGQGPDFWMRRASEISTRMNSAIGRLRTSAENTQARVNLDSATTALGDLMTLDKRAREALASEQRFLASDILFAEGLSAAQAVTDNLITARDFEVSAIQDRQLLASRLRLAMAPATLVLVLATAFTAGRAARPPAPSAAASMAQMIRDLPPPVKAPLGQPAPIKPPVAVAPPPPPAPLQPTANWPEAAELCVDLARVMDPRDIPALLERAAKTLEASGVVLWIINRKGTTLLPMLSHGYSDRMLAKLGTLDVSVDNVTSLSFRTMQPQTMPGTGQGASSAIAVPLVTTDGCNGVFAAEVQGARPAADALAMARIFAAQFATMIEPCDSGDAVAEA